MKLPGFNKNHDFVADEIVKKLILLFIFEKMEFPLTDESINDIIAHNPDWMTYIDFREALYRLVESKFVYRTANGAETSFSLTQAGRGALEQLYQKIPASLREEVIAFAKENRQKFKRRQEYTWDYFKNPDGKYTAVLRIRGAAADDNLLEIRLKVDTRAGAKNAVQKWRDKASSVYEQLYMLTLNEGEGAK